MLASLFFSELRRWHRSQVGGIPIRKVYADLRRLTEILAANSEMSGKLLTRPEEKLLTDSFRFQLCCE